MTESFWNAARVIELRAHFAAGLSSSEICAAMGTASRNVIIGKLTRLGLNRDMRPQRLPRRSDHLRLVSGPRKPEKLRIRRPKSNFLSVKTSRMVPGASQMTAEPTLPDPSRHCDLVDLTNEKCRWPVTDAGPHRFCGTREADVTGGIPYCPHHASMAYSRRAVAVAEPLHAV